MLHDESAQERLASLDRKIRRLEDIDAMQNLLVAYASAVDNNDWDRLAGLFADDAHFVIGVPFQVDVRSPAAVVTVLQSMSEVYRRMRHKIVNVGIDPESGTGAAYYTVSMIANQQNQPMVCEGNYRYRFVKTAGGWRIGQQIIDVAYLSPAPWPLENA